METVLRNRKGVLMVWTLWKEKNFTPTGIRTPAVQPVAVAMQIE
jgi:hypothetical protein